MATAFDEDNIPNPDECDGLCKEFASITNTDTAMGHMFLQENGWKLEASLDMYFRANSDHNAGAGSSRASNNSHDTQAQESSGSSATKPIALTSGDDRSNNLRLLSWNFDGLDQKGIEIRTKAACTIILRDKPTVVFLQEVINESLDIIVDYLSDIYWVLNGKRRTLPPPAYFTLMLLDKKAVSLDREPELIPFSGSIMDRTLLKIEVDVFGTPCVLMTTHLESTKEFASERTKQLRVCFDILTRQVPTNAIAFFGGDLNVRDEEVIGAGDIPKGVEDLWIACGSPKQRQYTWDCLKNNNITSFEDQKFKPRARFDRIYMKHNTDESGPGWKPKTFCFVGTERIMKYGRFPSDHWGIMVDFEKI